MPDPVVLYSTVTKLAFLINERYYGNVHYVWCSPHFSLNSPSTPPSKIANPPSSRPADVYQILAKDVAAEDRHSAQISQNRLGILKGANTKLTAGVISPDQEQEVRDIVAASGIQEFSPLLFIIPFERVKTDVIKVPVANLAHPLSEEYIVEELKANDFDIINWGV